MSEAQPDRIAALEARLAQIEAEGASIREELRRLREAEPAPRVPPTPARKVEFSDAAFPHAPVSLASTQDEKTALFLDLFHGRRDLYAKRFESKKTGRSGYEPVCANLWRRPLCDKPRVKCRACPHRVLVPLSAEVAARHLAGEITIGVYPLLPAETCWFLAVDFDKDGWQEDALAFMRACSEQGLTAALERSRSGRGGHVWLFFREEVPARTARQMGAALITQVMTSRPSMGLDSYDRMLPNQDSMPAGGFGNLIGLPLQRTPARLGHSLFVDEALRVYRDQWAFLSSLARNGAAQVEEIAQQARMAGRIIGVRPVSLDEGEEDPWVLPPSRRRRVPPELRIEVPERVEAVLSDELYVPKAQLPPPLLNEVVRLAAFQNPEFYRAQAMRQPVFGKPRVIGCASDTGKHIGLPRGCIDDLRSLMADWGSALRVDDQRHCGTPLVTRFSGELRADQLRAAEALLQHDFGVLAATTAFGKTVVAIFVLAARGVNTLILVHRRHLMDQWVERLATFLELDRKNIGVIGGSRRKPTGIVDVALMQSLYCKGDVDDVVAGYGHLIVDECHRISAPTFELVARRCRARFVTGLSATVVRKDGKHPIVLMQCGPIRFRASAKEEAKRRPFAHRVEVIRTGFALPERPHHGEPTADEPGIQDIFRMLAADEARNVLIADRALSVLAEGRSPVLLTERRGHLDWFRQYLEGKTECLVILHGGMGAKERRAAWELLQSTALSGASRLVIATGKYLGEGFDDARLDTLLLAMPVSWRGTVAQYAGRLHRLFAGKREVIIYDFLDAAVPVLTRMLDRRRKGYAALGYALSGEAL